jgi:hypothetical protein
MTGLANSSVVKIKTQFSGQVAPILHTCLVPSSLASLEPRFIKKFSCSSNFGLPGNTLCQKKCGKTTNKEDNMRIRVRKADVPKNAVELNSEIQENYKVSRLKLLIGKKDNVTVVDLSATLRQNFA